MHPPGTAISPSATTPSTWTLTDGHAGNTRQAEALANALALPHQPWTLEARAPWRWFAPRRLPGAGKAFGEAFARTAAPSLAIGCGRQAGLATRLLRERGARAVQILDPRLDPRHWDLVVAPEHDQLLGANVIPMIGSLHPVDDLWLAAARQAFASFAALPSPRTALLLGGASAHARFDDALYDAILRDVARRVTEEGGCIMATASRRTPASVRARMREQFLGVPGTIWTEPGDGANPYAGLLAWADRIVCTADSVNMLSEASATLVPVYVAGHAHVGGRPRHFLDTLLRMRRVQPFEAEALETFEVTPLRETARVAAEVRQRLSL